ncbi:MULTISPECIES: glycosyltransferase family 2 protein [unclassified Paraflavitalea]|uniref:glycosyltransferase family 2 protein n=1 Tax=unclassified Paraflavitalea TaxID=2798305 RepID=UPI003D33A93D
MSSPIVSVLMTSFNRENFIELAVESVLSSNLNDFELIIVDDGSVDKTVEIARSYQTKDSRVKVYCNDVNLGDYPNRNKAASYANGKYIKYLDSDDIMYPHTLNVMVDSMEQFPEAGLGLSGKGKKDMPHPYLLTPDQAYREHFGGFGHLDRAPGSAIIRRDVFEKVGGFTGKRMIGDNELWLILARYYPVVIFPPDLYWARTHAGQESKSDYAKKYASLRKSIFIDALNHPDCPLPVLERKNIIKNLSKVNYKRKLINLFR